jgi:rod shape-determining protein MreD
VRGWGFLAVGCVLALLQANAFRLFQHLPVVGWTPSLLLPLMLFMGVREYSLARGALVAATLGYVTDLLSIAPVGLFAFTYAATFVLARTAGVRLAAQTSLLQVVLVLFFALLEGGAVLVLLAIFGRDPYVPQALAPMLVPHALATAAVAPLVFRAAERVASGAPRFLPPQLRKEAP